jgi:hypothetical protein
LCTGGATCKSGSCACAMGHTYCAGRCVDTQVSDANCSGCGIVCQLPKHCASGACR